MDGFERNFAQGVALLT